MRPFYLTIATGAGLVALALTQAVADPAPPQTAATTVAPVTAKANPEDKVVCKYQTQTCSRLGGERVCMKQSDWKAQAAEARRQRDFAPPAGISGSR